VIVVFALAACLRPLPGQEVGAPPQTFDVLCLRDQDGPCVAAGSGSAGGASGASSTVRVTFEGACPRVLVGFQGTEPFATEPVFARVAASTKRGGDATPMDAYGAGNHPLEAAFGWPDGLERARLRWGCDEDDRSVLKADEIVNLELGRAVAEGGVLRLTLPGPSPTASWVAPALRDVPPPPPGPPGGALGGPGRPPPPGGRPVTPQFAGPAP
jgi:hypothetical protein